MCGNYFDFLLDPVYNPNQAAPAPTTIEINPDCSNVGLGKFIYHITHLYSNMMYVVMNILGNIRHWSTACAKSTHF